MTSAAERRTVTHVCVLHQFTPVAGRVGRTAIDKRPVEGPVEVRELGLDGDAQADKANHGGPDKAVYLFSATEIDYWQDVVGREIPPGGIGENLRVAGPLVDEALIGERWRVGTTLEVEITGPRTPCLTFARWMERPTLLREFSQRARTGVYGRVVTPGAVQAGDEITVLTRPAHGVSVTRWVGHAQPEDARALLEAGAEGQITVAPYLEKYLVAAAGRDLDPTAAQTLLDKDAKGSIRLAPSVRDRLHAAVHRARAGGDDTRA